MANKRLFSQDQKLITGCWGEPRDTELVRVAFDEHSHIDLWFAEDVLWGLCARDVKAAAHVVASALLRDTEGETPAAAVRPGRTEPVGEKKRMGAHASERKAAAAYFEKKEDKGGLTESATSHRIPDRSGAAQGEAAVGRRLSVTGRRAAGGADEGTSEKNLGTVLAYRARVRVSSVVLHFLAKGLHPGAFLFLACRTNHDTNGCAGKRSGGEDGSQTGSGREGQGGDEHPEPLRNGRADPENAEASSQGDGHGAALWVTDESVPLLQGLKSQWGEASALASGGGGDGRMVQDREEAGFENRSPTLTLRIMPSGRAPLPAICCGVCGSSWEIDCFGRGYRSYHLAVANHASLVWYIRRRFSEFLALHESVARRGKCYDGEDGRIPLGRLPKPPARTFGLIKIFPETMEKLRRDQLEAYIQELLSIPEALTNPSVLSFLGLISTSSHDLMSPSNSRPTAGSVEGSPNIPSRRTISSPSNSRPRSHSVVEVSREGGGIVSGGSRQPLPICTKKEVAVRAVNSSFAEGTTFDSTGAAGARKKCRQGDECSGVVSEDRSGDHRAEGAGGDGRGGGPRGSTGESGLRKVERISTLERAVGGGDIFLFRCRGVLSALQRWVSRSEWDHVGVVVSGEDGKPLELLESTPNGVQLNPLVERVREYQEDGFAFRVAFRRLKCPRRAEARSRLEAFARQAEGKGYGIVLPFPLGGRREEPPVPQTPPALAPRETSQPDGARPEAGHASTTSSPSRQCGNSHQLPPSYLCSQLVGAALSEMGLVRDGIGGKEGPWSWVLPAAFAKGGAVDIDLADGVTFGEEILVDSHEPEVAGAFLLAEDLT